MENFNTDKNYIYPFFWPDENAPEKIASEVEAVYESGCKGLCLEARPFERFGQEEWWHTVKTVLREAGKRNMKVWILDDKHFPTGYANGWIEKKYPHLRRRWIYEHHFDVYGPKKNVTARLTECTDEERILFACAFRRTGENEDITGEPRIIEIRENAAFCEFDVPEGLWRVFVIIESRDPNRSHGWHIDMLSEESSRVLIDAVYEEHYKNLAEYFGTTLTGFFSDEPCFSAQHTERWGYNAGVYFRTVGQPGVSLPWHDNVLAGMTEETKKNVMAYLPVLWYPHGEYSPVMRLAYMNTVTKLWNKNFSLAVGDWCRSHGLLYTGHIIEDLNAHSSLGGSAGHYFRGLGGQDVSGIDIVLNQLIPGMADYITSASVEGGIADGNFYHYTLAQLGSSLARITPRMNGRAMCELFGAYGWAETVPVMKWMADFLLIRGINRFVPHAFSVKYPFDDCPPHFYANGCNPQYEGFCALMPYINRVSALLDGSVKKTEGAIFYYAENEWVSAPDFTTCDPAAKALYDSHIDYDILPLDALEEAAVTDGKLFVNGIPHSFLVIPGAKRYPERLTELAEKFIREGLPVFTAQDRDFRVLGESIPVKELADTVKKKGLAYGYGIEDSKLRIARFDKGEENFFFLFNEEPSDTVCQSVTFPFAGSFNELHLLNGEYYSGLTSDGKIEVCLQPGESVIFVFGKEGVFPEKKEALQTEIIDIGWDIELKQTGIDPDFIPYKKNSPLINVTSLDEMNGFSGEIRYKGHFISDTDSAVINLGEVGFTAKIKINGTAYPIRITAPYEWDISDSLKKGENEVELIAANTLSNRIHDDFSTFTPLAPSGVQGPITIKRI